MMKDRPSPEGRWALTMKHSDYHFDKTRKEQPFSILGHFHGEDWGAEVDNLIKISDGGAPFSFLMKKDHKWEAEHIDMIRAGYRASAVFVNRIMKPFLSRQNAPTLFKMIDWMELQGPLSARLHVQHPGQVFPFHIDLLNVRHSEEYPLSEMEKEPELWTRFQVQLAEWEYGHMWAIGNTYWNQWKTGEIMHHSWHNIPHGTANASLTARVTLQVSGRITDATRKKIGQVDQKIDLRTIKPGTFNETEL